MALHSDFRKGQKVLIIFNDGTRVVDKYIEKTSKGIRCDHGRYDFSKVRSTVIYRGGEIG